MPLECPVIFIHVDIKNFLGRLMGPGHPAQYRMLKPFQIRTAQPWTCATLSFSRLKSYTTITRD